MFNICLLLSLLLLLISVSLYLFSTQLGSSYTYSFVTYYFLNIIAFRHLSLLVTINSYFLKKKEQRRNRTILDICWTQSVLKINATNQVLLL